MTRTHLPNRTNDRTCGICGVIVARMVADGEQWTPFGPAPKYRMEEIDMGKFGHGPGNQYRCTAHSGVTRTA